MDLNSKQKDYVNCEKDSLVIACPGSGKTRSICAKVIKIAGELKSKKSHVAVITYTNKAAEELSERLDHAGVDQQNIWIGTIHGFCLEWILRSFRSDIPELRHGFSVADEYVCNEIMDRLKKNYGYAFYVKFNSKLDENGNLLEDDFKKKKLIKEYRDELASRKLIDFDQILYYCYRFLHSQKNASLLLSNVFNWIIVDEYQDTQLLQYLILSTMAAANQNLRFSFVGDPDQAIYTTLGGLALSSEELSKVMGRVLKDHTFDGCYRSNQEIVDFYSRFQSKPTKIMSQTDDFSEPLIQIDKEIHRADLSQRIVEILTTEFARGVKDSDICLIAPQWDMLNVVVKDLKAELPERRIDSPGLSPISKNRENTWYHVAKVFLTDSSVRNLNRRKRWASESMKFLGAYFPIASKVKNSLQFLEMCNLSKSDADQGSQYLHDSFLRLLNNLSVDLEMFPSMKAEMDVFLEATKKRLEYWELIDTTDLFKTYFLENEGIAVNSCLGVKGLEYRVVIAFGFVEGKVPHFDILYGKTYDHLDESRKIIYVTGSRAKERLYLFCEQGHITSTKKPLVPNRLIPDEP